MQLIAYLHAHSGPPSAVAATSRRTLRGLFPDWPPGAPEGEVGLLWWFRVLFAGPLPAFSAKLNALVTWWAAQWLMGPCDLEDLDVVGGRLAAVSCCCCCCWCTATTRHRLGSRLLRLID